MEFPRRINLDRQTPAEQAILDAVSAVERAGAHILLTEAVGLLFQAREKVADFVDGTPMTADSAPATVRETVEKVLNERHVAEALALADRIEALRGTQAWWDRRDDIPDGAFVSLGGLIAIRKAAALLSPPSETQEIERLREALEGLMPYRAHNRRCAYEMTEICTCGMRQAADSARRALTPTLEDRP